MGFFHVNERDGILRCVQDLLWVQGGLRVASGKKRQELFR
jgi:hypothetical protein